MTFFLEKIVGKQKGKAAFLDRPVEGAMKIN
jgi:hypothetical protein